MTCKRCGECCFPFSIALDRDDDAKRWLTYHGLLIRDVSEDRMVYHSNSRCEMLTVNADGTTSCAVYDDRPKMCSDFICRRAQD